MAELPVPPLKHLIRKTIFYVTPTHLKLLYVMYILVHREDEKLPPDRGTV